MSAYLRVLGAVRARALGPYLLDTGERRAELVDPSSFVPPDQLDAPGKRLARLERAIPASMRVSRTWRCDIRNRVMTGTLAVVNERVVPPAVAPQETTRPKRPCASSAMRTRCSLVSSRNRSIRASSAVAAACGGGALLQFHGAERANYEDLVVVNGHLRNLDEEVVRQPAREPGLDLRSLLGRGALLGSRAPSAPRPAGAGTTPSPALARVMLMFMKCHE